MSQGTDYIFGIRTIAEAIKSGKDIDKVLIRKGLTGELFQELFLQIKENNIPYQYVPVEKLNRVTRKNHQGVIAFISQVAYHNIETLIPGLFEQGQVPFIIVLDSLTDVRNIGAIARTAECAGAHAIIIPDKGSAQINADALKTSAGALHYIPVCKEKSLLSVIKFLKNSGLIVVAATEKATKCYFEIKYTVPVAIILGSEETGIGSELLKASNELAKIPINGNIESLNVSAAASVILYEVVKQRIKN